jgi:hypothetical protein
MIYVKERGNVYKLEKRSYSLNVYGLEKEGLPYCLFHLIRFCFFSSNFYRMICLQLEPGFFKVI